MGKTIRLTERSARALMHAWPSDWKGERGGTVGRAFDELERALSSLRSPKKLAARKSKRTEKAASAKDRREKINALYDAVLKRADGKCECGCGLPFNGENWRSYANDPEMDHFFTKAKAPENERTCWMLTRYCHRQKHRESPDAATWRAKFFAHAKRHGFEAEAERALGRLAFVTTRAELAGGRHAP